MTKIIKSNWNKKSQDKSKGYKKIKFMSKKYKMSWFKCFNYSEKK